MDAYPNLTFQQMDATNADFSGERLPNELREQFIEQIVTTYLQQYSLIEAAVAHVCIARLEAETSKPT